MPFSEELVRSSTLPIVLALVAERPMYGYELVKLVNARTAGRLEWKEGTLYPLLHRCEAEGWIVGRWREAPETGKPRKYYAITRRGRGELARRTREWRQFVRDVGGLLPESA